MASIFGSSIDQISEVTAVVATAIVSAIVAALAVITKQREPKSPFSGQPVNDPQLMQMVLSGQRVSAEQIERMVSTLENVNHNITGLRETMTRIEVDVAIVRAVWAPPTRAG